MRSNGWQLPYHPLQVVAIAVFLALGFAFYVFFLPFVGKKLLHYVVMGLYTPLVASVFCLYVWCAATDPGDPGVFKSKKYLNIGDNEKKSQPTRQGCEWMSSINETDATKTGNKPLVEGSHADTTGGRSGRIKMERSYCCNLPIIMVLFSWFPFSLCTQLHSCEEFSEQQMSEDGMFFCSLCEVEVFKYSKHCRVCDKCVDGFDHHCRWLNNCIGKRNYQRFFILMVSALLLLILQWSIGVLVLILCFLDRKQFSVEITSKLGSSFSLVPFIVVVGCCTFLAMVATLPLAQLFFFHVLLIKKGISTYDYIIALREREQQGPGSQQSPQMSPVSSFTGLSATSSFNAFHQAAWCTPPRLFVEDQFDVIPPETMSVCSVSKRMMVEEPLKKRSTSTIRISPWTLARLNAQEVSRAASEARKKSKILQPVWRREMPLEQEGNNSFGSSSDRLNVEPDMWRGVNKRDMYQMDLPLEPLATISATAPNSNSSGLTSEASSSLAPLQLEARSAFRTSHAMSSTGLGASSPDSSLESPELHPFRIPSSGAEEAHAFESLSLAGTAVLKAIQLSRSTSDGYEASGGEDSDRVPSGIVHRSSDWSNLLLHSEQSDMVDELKASPSIATSLQVNTRRL